MKVVDLGTRIGGTLSGFLRRGHRFFPSHAKFIRGIQFSDCLGIDELSKYRWDLEELGASFQVMDMSLEESVTALPEADFYLVSKLLHHLSDKDKMDALVSEVLSKARRGVWLRLLSFEDDSETGEGVLRDKDLRFGWSEKYTPYFCKDAVARIPRDVFNIELKPAKRVRHTNDFRVLPTSVNSDDEEYEVVMGHKPQIKLVPPLVAEWDLFIERKQYAD